MLGHPGISALEYAGELHKKRKGGKKPSLRDSIKIKSRISQDTQDTHHETSPPASSGELAEVEPSQTALEEFSSQQRRRGTFINHTPRDHEMRSPKRTEFPRSSSGTHTNPHNSYQGSSDGNTHVSGSQCGRNSSLGSWTPEKKHEVNTDSIVELDSKEVGCAAPNTVDSRPPTTHRGSATNSLATKVTVRSVQDTLKTYDDRELAASASSDPEQEDKKRQRRQTPYQLSSPKPRSTPRYSPLEPLVARHRHEKTGNNIDDLPPQVQIDDIGEASTFRAIQEYFDSQGCPKLLPPNIDGRDLTSSPPNIPLPSSLELPLPSSPLEPTPIFPAEELEVPDEPTPGVPDRNPKRLDARSAHLSHSISGHSLNSDFASAARGQYSPYEINVHKKRSQVRVGQAATPGSSTLGRMAPPILGHAALTATTELNDLSYYLKNTGPSPEPTTPQGRKSSFSMFKVGKKKSLAARVGSVEGSPQKSRPKTPTPACAREMTTSSGVKHLRIMIPTDDLAHDQTITIPISTPGSKRRSKHLSITWTDEMLNPLASPELENALSNFNSAEMDSPVMRTRSIRSPRKSPKSPTFIPVDIHPLVTREEQTKARKLRDLQRIKKKEVHAKENDTIAGALPAPMESPDVIEEADKESVDEDGEEENSVARLQQQVIFLQHQNAELAEALGKIVGLEPEDGHLDPEDVLRAYEQVRLLSTSSRE